jgi:hypothetical protein
VPLILPATLTVSNAGFACLVNRPGDVPPRTGSIGGRSLHQDRPH